MNAPFALVGSFSGLDNDTGERVSFTLSGQGSTTAFNFGVIADEFVRHQQVWIFDAAPIPEPGTILLLSAGAIVGLGRGRTRLQRRK